MQVGISFWFRWTLQRTAAGQKSEHTKGTDAPRLTDHGCTPPSAFDLTCSCTINEPRRVDRRSGHGLDLDS